MKNKLLIISLISICSNAFGIINARVDQNKININDVVNLTIDLPNSNAKPDLNPLLQNFQIIGQSNSSQTTIINGNIQSSNQLIISLVAKKTGTFTIPPIKVDNDYTPTFNIVVSNSTTNQNLQSTDKTPALDFTAEVSTTKGFVGVPIDLTIKLFYAVNISNVTLQPINVDGLNIVSDGKSRQSQTTIGTQQYMVVEQHFTATPTKTGIITIPALNANGIIDSNPFGFSLIHSGQPFNLNSKPIILNIQEIPDNINPNKWLPATNITIKDEWSPNSTNIKVGEPIVRTLTITATGTDANTIPELEFESINEVNIYPEKSQKTTNTQTGKTIGSKTFKVVYIPNHNGKLVIPQLDIPWWNLNTGKEEKKIIPSKTFNITGEVPQLKQESNNKITQDNVNQSSTQSQHNYLIILAGTLAIFGLMAVISWWIRRKKLDSNLVTEIASIQTNSMHLVKKSQQEYIKDIQLACDNKDINQLNHAIIDWAKHKFNNQTIYTLQQVQSLSKIDEFNAIINQLSAALYNNQEFNYFDKIITYIHKLNDNKVSTKQKDKFNLPRMYPDL